MTPLPPRIAHIIRETAGRHKLTPALLTAETKLAHVCLARDEAMHTARALTCGNGKPPSFTVIGRWFGGRDHSSVHTACARHEARMGAE